MSGGPNLLGKQQILRMDGIMAGDGGQHDYHAWFDGGQLYTDASFHVRGPSPHIDVTMFGAKGDGATDDRAAIQAAIDYAKSLGKGTVFLPPGKYLVKKSFTALDNSYSNICICGAGMQVSTIVQDANFAGDGTSNDVFHVSGTQIEFRELTIQGHDTYTAGYNLIGALSCNTLTIDRCELTQGPDTGVKISDSNRCAVSNCYIHDNQGEGAIFHGTTERSILIGCRVYNNGDNGVDSNGNYNLITGNVIDSNGSALGAGGREGFGVTIEGDSVLCRGNVISGNAIKDNFRGGINVSCDGGANDGNDDTIIVGNHIYHNSKSGTTNTHGFGIGVAGTSPNKVNGVVIVGNVINSNGSSGDTNPEGIFVSYAVNGIITGNYIANSQEYGIKGDSGGNAPSNFELSNVYVSNGSGDSTGFTHNVGRVISGALAMNAGNFFMDQTDGALIVPRVTAAQRTALTAINGMIVYQTDGTPSFYKYVNGSWATF